MWTADYEKPLYSAPVSCLDCLGCFAHYSLWSKLSPVGFLKCIYFLLAALLSDRRGCSMPKRENDLISHRGSFNRVELKIMSCVGFFSRRHLSYCYHEHHHSLTQLHKRDITWNTMDIIIEHFELTLYLCLYFRFDIVHI